MFMKVDSTITRPATFTGSFAPRLEAGLRQRVRGVTRRPVTTRSGVVRLALLNQPLEIEAGRLTLQEVV